MSVQGVRAVLFDLYETLIGLNDERAAAGRAQVAERAGLPADAILAGYLQTLDDRMLGIRGCGAPLEDLAAVLDAAGAPATAPGELAALADLEGRLWAESIVVFPDTVPCLTALRERGMRLALVSNCSSLTRRVLAESGLEGLVDAVVLSCDVGLRKPDPAMLRLALERVECDPSDAMLLDDVQGNLDAAAVLGMRTCLISRGGSDGVAGGPGGGAHPVLQALSHLTGPLSA